MLSYIVCDALFTHFRSSLTGWYNTYVVTTGSCMYFQFAPFLSRKKSNSYCEYIVVLIDHAAKLRVTCL